MVGLLLRREKGEGGEMSLDCVLSLVLYLAVLCVLDCRGSELFLLLCRLLMGGFARAPDGADGGGNPSRMLRANLLIDGLT